MKKLYPFMQFPKPLRFLNVSALHTINGGYVDNFYTHPLIQVLLSKLIDKRLFDLPFAVLYYYFGIGPVNERDLRRKMTTIDIVNNRNL